ncbi:methyltransferase [Actimicrobium antarcticum]|uniref:Methyltransferase n=1 Tax=Actimicrobium antarcticum TaxID=1051899 RepID=A0ABP7SI64_9BURK
MTTRDYLCIDAYLGDMVGARALASAFEIGLIDRMLEAPSDLAAVQADVQIDAAGLDLLLGMLRAHRVLDGDDLRLSADFMAALAYRDLLEAKLQFANLVAPDFLHLFTALLMAPQQFKEQARLFNLFSYQRCFEATPDNLAQTARWMRLTTALTKYEAQACLSEHDFSGYRRMLDVGGNSGEFALRACRAHPGLQATVFDLPLVCDIGRAHLASAPEAARISFVKAPIEPVALPAGHDLVTFKSMLHDWPDAEMATFLRRAHAALTPGGTLMIFERGQLQIDAGQLGYGQLPLMLFFRSYRAPQAYCAQLQSLEFDDITVRQVQLDMPFILITAVKRA